MEAIRVGQPEMVRKKKGPEVKAWCHFTKRGRYGENVVHEGPNQFI